jgi:ABC-type phosphate/phosphonate transport system permease subunit
MCSRHRALAFPVATAIWLFVVLPIYYGEIMLDTLKDIASLGTGISAVVAVFAFLANRDNQKEAVVQRAYFDYAKMALDHPELASPFKSEVDYQKQTFRGEPEKFEKYEWFLSAMFVMTHFVKRLRGDKKPWKELVINQMSYHWQYIEHFWDEKLFIRNWRTVLGPEMREGIARGKENFKPKDHLAIAPGEPSVADAGRGLERISGPS